MRLRVSPGGKSSELRGSHGDRAIKLRVAAPPVDGKANAQVERFLAGLLGVARGRVSVVSGASSRDKTVLVEEVEAERVRKTLLTEPVTGGVG